MNKREIQIAFTLLCLIALFPIAWLGAIDWIQYDERAVGENSPYYDDVVNRPTKQLFQIYTTEHHEDGTHKALTGYTTDSVFQLEHNTDGTHTTAYLTSGDVAGYMTTSAYDTDLDSRADSAESLSDGTYTSSPLEVRTHLDSAHVQIDDAGTSPGSVWSSDKVSTELANVSVSEYALDGDGTGYLAESGTTVVVSVFDESVFTLYGVVRFDRLDTAESIFKRIVSLDGITYDKIAFDVGKNSLNQLYFTTGNSDLTTWETVTSGFVLTADNIGKPLEIGVQVDRSTLHISFLFEGQTDAAQTLTSLFPLAYAGDQQFLGEGLDGAVYTLSAGRGIKYDGLHTPPGEGLSQCTGCLLHYDFDDGSGTLVHDVWGSRNMTVSGSATWQAVGSHY